MLGLPLDERDIDDLIDVAPEVLDSDIPPPLLLGVLLWDGTVGNVDAPERYRLLCQHLLKCGFSQDTFAERWLSTLRTARERAGREWEQAPLLPVAVKADRECPTPECPLRERRPHADLPSEDEREGNAPTGVLEDVTAHVVQVQAQGLSPEKGFLNMAMHVRGRLKHPVKRVIVTDPYVHCDNSEDGAAGGHDALLNFLEALGLGADMSFLLELTPTPKRGTDGRALEDTTLGRKLLAKFPRMVLRQHRPCRGGFHDRFYLVIDRAGRWDGLYGPSINGLSSCAIVLVGDLAEDSPAKRRLMQLLG